jgi:hypothetical protein
MPVEYWGPGEQSLAQLPRKEEAAREMKETEAESQNPRHISLA